MNILDNGIESYGVSNNIPIKSIYFKEFDFQVIKELEDNNILIEKILSVNCNIDIGEVNIIKTPIMISNEGVFLSGYKLKVELIINMKIKYMIESVPKTIGFYREKLVKTIYIVLPLEHNKVSMIDLLRKKKIAVKQYVEDIYCERRKENVIYINISAIITADFINN